VNWKEVEVEGIAEVEKDLVIISAVSITLSSQVLQRFVLIGKGQSEWIPSPFRIFRGRRDTPKLGGISEFRGQFAANIAWARGGHIRIPCNRCLESGRNRIPREFRFPSNFITFYPRACSHRGRRLIFVDIPPALSSLVQLTPKATVRGRALRPSRESYCRDNRRVAYAQCLLKGHSTPCTSVEHRTQSRGTLPARGLKPGRGAFVQGQSLTSSCFR